ncbi:MAG: hypothetical protein WBM00_03540 [Solirubrobacterales bacterium]
MTSAAQVRRREQLDRRTLKWLRLALLVDLIGGATLTVGLLTGLGSGLTLAFALTFLVAAGCAGNAQRLQSRAWEVWPSLWLASLIPAVGAGLALGYLSGGEVARWWLPTIFVLNLPPLLASAEMVVRGSADGER